MVARDVLLKMRQDRDEPVRAYSARLKGQAWVCQFVVNCQCPSCPNHDICVGADYSDIVVRDQVILGCADHDIKLDCLTEKGPSASLEEVTTFVEGKESEKLSLQQPTGGSEAAAPISSFRKQQRRASSNRAHPHPCLLCGARTVVRSATVAAKMNAPQTAPLMAKLALSVANKVTSEPCAGNIRQPVRTTDNAAHVRPRRQRPLPLCSSRYVA